MGFYLNIKSSKWSGFDMWIYSITNNINGKEYIGKTTREDFRRRWCEHQKQARKNKNHLNIKVLFFIRHIINFQLNLN